MWIALEDARARVAACIGAEPREIYFTSGGSEADNQAIMSAARSGERKGKRHIISTAFEHHAVLHTLDKLKERGFEITLLDVHADGIVTPEQVAEAIREDTCLVTIMFANNEIGTIQPIAEIGKICRERGVLFHTDAVQAAGHVPIDVKAQNIDMLSMSGHKFHGPKGSGVLYAKRGVVLDNIINGGAQERGKRAGTENIPAIMGLAAALEEACRDLDENAAQMSARRDRLIAGLRTIPYSELNGDAEKRLPSNVNFCFEGIEGESLLLMLDDKGAPNRPGGCTTCYGAIEISSSDYKTLKYNSHYYDLAQCAKVIRPGAVRIGASGYTASGLTYLAFRNPDGSKAFVALNRSAGEQTVAVYENADRSFKYTIPARP